MTTTDITKRHWFYAQSINESNPFELDELAFKHCIQALRHQVGDSIILTNGNGLVAEAVLLQVTRKQATVEIISKKTVPPPTTQITLATAMTKNNTRNEWMLEKLTELGVAHIIPLITHRSEKQRNKDERNEKILISAMLQSQQSYLPLLHPAKSLLDVLTSNYDLKMIAHCESEGNKTELRDVVWPTASKVLLCIGPEGDFAPDEIELALKYGAQAVSLGSTRLRTETAAIAGAAVLQVR